MLPRYYLKGSEMVPVAPIIAGITFSLYIPQAPTSIEMYYY
jgi:hypothetical protein